MGRVAVGIGLDQPLGLGGGHARVARSQVGARGELEGLGQYVLELAAHPVDPVALVARQERKPCELRCAHRGPRRSRGVIVHLRPRRRQGRPRLVEIDQGVRRQPQAVAASGPLEQLAGVETAGLDDAAHIADDAAQRGGPRLGKLVWPERVGKLAAAHVATMLGRQIGEDEFGPSSRECGRARYPRRADGQPAQQPDRRPLRRHKGSMPLIWGSYQAGRPAACGVGPAGVRWAADSILS